MAFINYVTQIQFDFGAVRLLRSECERVGISKPLIVTDQGVLAAGLVARAQAVLGTGAGGMPHAVFADTPSNPTEAAVRAATALYHAQGCDGIVAFGGGSALDCGKGVAISATHPGPLTHYATILGGAGRITANVAPLIAVPTTSGTGSEVARGAILIVDDGRKLGFHNWNLVPKAAICDPELTLGLPSKLTAATGMDAVAHCMETYMSAAFNPPADGIGLDGLTRAWAHIERATHNGQDREARRQLMSASMQGAMAFQKGLGCVHSLSHSLSGVQPALHHGTLNALFLPAVLRFNAAAASVQQDQRLQRMVQAMGIALAKDADASTAASTLADAVRDMNARLGLPSRLSDYGVKAEWFDRIVAGALVDHCHATNPRIASKDDYLALLDEAM